MASFKPLVNSFTRVFIVEGGARADHRPTYHSCLRAGGVDQSFGDIEKIECPDPQNYGKFVEMAVIRGAVERATTSLMGRYASDVASDLLRLARQGCSVDVQVHIGLCSDASEFNSFDKAIILEDAYLTNYSADELGALESGEQAAVNETADISAKEVYEVLPLSLVLKAGDLVTNEVLDGTVCDSVSCGECTNESDGAEKFIFVTSAAGGSPGTPPDVVYTNDKGETWYAHDIDSLLSTQDADGVACVGEYVVVVSNDDAGLHYVLKDSLFDVDSDHTWTEVSSAFNASGLPRAIWSVGTKAFVVGNGGYIYSIEDPTAVATVLDAGVATTSNLQDVHALSGEFAVAVGDSGNIVKTENGTSWSLVNTSPVGFGITLNCVWLKSEKEWFIGTSDGRLFYTEDGGTSWTTKSFTGSGAGAVRDIAFATKSVGYLSHSTATPAGRVLRTYDGGYSWNVLPEGTAQIPANDRISVLAVSANDPNLFIGGGLADNGTDGVIIVGKD